MIILTIRKGDMMGKRVLMVGWHPSAVDFSRWPGLTAEKLLASLNADKEKIAENGHEVTLAFIHTADSAAGDLQSLLEQGTYDIVMIGAGVRRVDEHFLVFERLVNVVHEFAPKARIAFNTRPEDSADAIERWA